MRVGPVGAYFADDLSEAASQAAASAKVTHQHPEGVAGAIAVAVAAGAAWRAGQSGEVGGRGVLLEPAIDLTPASEVRDGLVMAAGLSADVKVGEAAVVLGNGSRVTCPDTVPFCLWCAQRHLDSYEEALWSTVSVLGDADTNCAIVGGIVALAAGMESIPADWLESREPLAL